MGVLGKGERRFSEEYVKVDERKECIKEIQKKTDSENGEEGK